MPDEKIYHPEVLPETPFPGQDVEPIVIQTQPSGGTSTPTTTPAKLFPKKRIATELISTALNTRSKKILQEFELQQSGSIKIGDYKSGETGDLRLTPNGLTARDKAGLTTFAIDGTTGNAVFKGEVQAADFIVIDDNGLVSLSNFSSGGVIKTASQNITGDNTWTDITLLTHTIVLTRETNVLFFGVVSFALSGWDAAPLFRLNYNGLFSPSSAGWSAGVAPRDAVTNFMPPFSFTQLLTLPSGTVTIVIQGATSTPDETLTICHSGDGTPSTFGYVILGR